jgi:hypothetical protein
MDSMMGSIMGTTARETMFTFLCNCSG